MTSPIPGPNVPIKSPTSDQINTPWYTFFNGLKGLIDSFIERVSNDISGFGTAAKEDVGTAAGNVVQLDSNAKLPAVDGSQLTGIIIPGYASYTEVIDTSGTWVKPAGLTGDEIVIVELWGGGGGGGRGNSASVGSGGGGGAYATRSFLASEIADSIPVGIGAGGAGATSNTTAGGDGGNSTFGTHLTAYGGAGGGPSGSGTAGIGGGGGGANSKGSGSSGGGPVFLADVTAGAGTIDYSYGGNGADGNIGITAGSSIYGGGGGSGSIYDPAGDSVFGGAGGGRSGGSGGGSSVHAGDGGAFGAEGEHPAGGGGGCADGAPGRCIVRIVLLPT